MAENNDSRYGRNVGLRQAVDHLDKAAKLSLPTRRSTKLQRAVHDALKDAADKIWELRKEYSEK